jgi:hypothetical protein
MALRIFSPYHDSPAGRYYRGLELPAVALPTTTLPE